MHGGIDGNLCFQHTADHALHAEHFRRGGNFQGVVNAAALHQLDVNEVSRAHLQNGHGVFRGEYGLVRQHRHIAPVGDVFQSGKVMGAYGLFHKLNVQTKLLHLIQNLHGLLGRPCLIGVDADDDVLAHGIAHGAEPGDVQLRVYADLHFQAVIAPGNGFQGIADHGVRVVDGDGDIGDDLLPPTAQKLVNRDIVQLPVQIPQRHVNGSLGAGIAHDTLLHRLEQRLQLVHVPSDNGLGDVILNGADDRAGGVAGNGARGRGFAVAHSAAVGVDFYDDIFHAADTAQSGFEGGAQRNADAPQTDTCDFHIGHLL